MCWLYVHASWTQSDGKRYTSGWSLTSYAAFEPLGLLWMNCFRLKYPPFIFNCLTVAFKSYWSCGKALGKGIAVTVNILCLVREHQRTFKCHRLSEGISSAGFNRPAYEGKGHRIDKRRNKWEGKLLLIKLQLSNHFQAKRHRVWISKADGI